ncbi:MAG: hypothetical protein J5791_02945 [Fibrobacter sp.]|nr:hypothetical protein [Fibrobacter sp.]
MKKFILALGVLASTALAISQPHTHDGFFLNLTLGMSFQNFGYEYHATRYEGMTIDGDGVSLDADTKIGGCVAPNVALHLTITEVQNLTDLELKDGTRTVATTSQTESLLLLGFGVTYYFLDNIFFTGTFGLSMFTIEESRNSNAGGSSEAGIGFQVGVGKEWWAGDEWGMGVMGTFTYGSADDKDDIGEMSAYAVGVKFTMTFN